MFIKQCKDTFVRRFNDIGYIINQLTRHDRVYDNVGMLFLEKISREPKKIDDIINELYIVFKDVSYNELKNDFIEFIEDLENDKYIITGNSIEELNKKEPVFTYSQENPKKTTLSFIKQDYNLFEDTQDYFYYKFRLNPQVFDIQIELTKNCNERCVHCYIPNHQKNSAVKAKTKMVLRVLDEAKEMNAISVCFTGGEPFLHKDIVKILRYSRKNDFMITILTNGTVINNEIISILKEINLNQIQISVYSLRPKIHDAITKYNGSLNKTIETIEKLISNNIPVQISCPIMKINKNYYLDVLKWAHNNKMKINCDLIMKGQIDFNTNNLKHRLNIIETEKLIYGIVRNDKDYQERLGYLIPKYKKLEAIKSKPVCGVGISNILLSAEGEYFPCPGWQGFVLGDANDQSLKDVWENSERIKFLRNITFESFPQCLKCEAKDYCSVCMARNFNESNGDLFKVNQHFCKVAFLNKKLVVKSQKRKDA